MPSDKAKHQDTGVETSTQLLVDAFERVHELVPTVIEGLTSEDLTWRPDSDANSIAWLIWHLTRVQDSHLADLDGSEQIWAEKFALPYDESSIGFGQSSEEVGQFSVKDPALLSRYHEAVQTRTKKIILELSAKDYDRVIDDSYDPPVTIGTRIVSVVNDTTQHIGQASYVRGLVQRRRQ